MRRSEFWVLLGYVRARPGDALAMWKSWFGEDFPLVEPLLRPCPGVYAGWYPDPETGTHREVYKAGQNWVAVRDEGDFCDEFPLRLTESEVIAYRIDEDALRRKLQASLGLEGAATGLEPGFDSLGGCSCGPVRRQVYLCHGPDEKSSMAWAVKASVRSKGACLLLPGLTDTVDQFIRGAGMSGVSLQGNLKPLKPDKPTGACGIACRHFTPEPPAVEVLARRIGEGMSRIAEPVAPRFLFQRAGSHWDVIFEGGAPFHMEESLGVRYLDYLLHHPNEAISAFDLETAVRPEKAAARSRTSAQEQADPAAVRAYLREIDRLRAERHEAVEDGQHAEVDQIDNEIERLESELPGQRRSADTGERARDNVRKAISAALRTLRSGEGEQKAFAAHLRQCLSVGYELLYSQPEGRVWG